MTSRTIRSRTYTKDHTKFWSETIAAGDAFVLVTPGYNHGFPASLKNALGHLSDEWRDRPAGFVSYGGISGGLRAVQHLKTVTGALNMLALNEPVVAPVVDRQIDKGTFAPQAIQRDAAMAMLDAPGDWEGRMRRKRDAAGD